MRRIQLPDHLMRGIREHQVQQGEDRAAMGWGATDYLFTSVANGGMLKPDRLYAANV